MTILGAIDIGSNALRLVIGSATKGREVSKVINFREPVRLGQDVFAEGILSEETIARALGALAKFSKLMDEHHVDLSRVVATSALREARNRQVFIERAAEELGLHVELISGSEEARLVHLAVSRVIDLSRRRSILIDIGGGSVEITVAQDDDVVFSDSVKMGTVRLLQLFGSKKREQRSFSRLVERYANTLERRLRGELGEEKIQLCVGTGGNIEAIADILNHDKKLPPVISVSALSNLVHELETLSIESRMQKYRLKADRADVIFPAAVVLLEVAKAAGVSEVIAPGVGLKDGVLYDLVPEAKDRKAAHHGHQARAFALSLGRKYHFDEVHAEHVTRHALGMFDQTKTLHNLGGEERLLLEMAGLLHDVGQVISLNGHHKHGQYIINSTPFVGLDERERLLVSLVVRYHRKALPKDEHEDFAELSDEDKDLVKKLAAFLRIAEGLDRQLAQKVENIRISWDKSDAVLEIRGAGDLLLECWSAENKADLFQAVFKRTLRVKESDEKR